MTGELLLASFLVGLFTAWLLGLVMGKGHYGLLGDLCLGLFGGCVAVLIYEAVGIAAYAGIIGAMVAALIGAVGALVAQRNLRHRAA